jgi:ectoine hydroxylase-related dioxygenase (phytanoyl-CoA dioxygenase family)
MRININGKSVEARIDGPKSYGESRVLLQSDDDLTANTSWKEQGYSVEPFLADASFDELILGAKEFYKAKMAEVIGDSLENFNLEDYHQVVKSQELHLQIVKLTNPVSYRLFPINIEEVIGRISEILRIEVTLINPKREFERFHYRTVRPFSRDFNPLHRDAWLDHLRNGINLYVPVAGSTEDSSLGLIPGSHYWNESMLERTLEGAMINGVRYTVPALTDSSREFEIVRPNPGYNQVLVFSPYLIHGSAANFNKDQTRVSLEMRLYRK